MACDKSCFRQDLEPNPDVGGLGVLIGFLGTAWFAVFVVIVRFVLAFDPDVDPLHAPSSNERHTWRPNVIDFRIIRGFRKLRARTGDSTRWEVPMTKFLLAMSDVQLLTGLGILLSGFIGLSCYVSAYHWQLICYLAWFSNLTHAASLSSLRTYLYNNQRERNWRMALMVLLLVGLIVSLIPTAYFNWELGLDPYLTHEQASAANTSANARCFFSQSSAKAAWDQACLQAPPESTEPSICQRGFEQAAGTAAYESHILSVILLIFSFATRSFKMFRGLSDAARMTVRGKLSGLCFSMIYGTISLYRSYDHYPMIRRVFAVTRPLDVLLGGYLVAKLWAELLFSEFSDLYWLIVSSVWATVRLLSVRSSPHVNMQGDDMSAQNEWGFGQILPVFLLLGPIASFIVTMQGDRGVGNGRDTPLIQRLQDALNSHRGTACHSQQDRMGNTASEPHESRGEVHRLLADILGELELSQPSSRGSVHGVSESPRSEQRGGQIACSSSEQAMAASDVEIQTCLNSQQQALDDQTGAPTSAKVTHEENEGEVIQYINQKIILGITHVNIKKSASDYVVESWLIIPLLASFIFHIFIITLVSLLYLTNTITDLGNPTEVLPTALITILFTYPINSFVGVVTCLQVGELKFAEFDHTFIAFVLVIPLAWFIFAFILGISRSSIALGSLAPLGFLALRFCYLGFWSEAP